jgi:hypothetical protein
MSFSILVIQYAVIRVIASYILSIGAGIMAEWYSVKYVRIEQIL